MKEKDGARWLPPAGNGENRPPDIYTASRFFLLVMLLLLFVGAVLQAAHFEYGMLVTQWIIIFLPSLLYWKYFRVNLESFARLRPLETKFMPTISLLAVSSWILNVFIAVFLVQLLMGLGFEPQEFIPPPATRGQLISYYLVIAFSAGVCEEVFLRGTIMPSLEKQGLLPALVFSSLLFALMHLTVTNLVSAFILGLIMGLVVIKTGSLMAGILLHFFNNFVAVTYMYLAYNLGLDMYLENTGFFLSVMLFLAAAGGLFFGLHRLQQDSLVPPLLKDRERWLPRGWFNWPVAAVLVIFLLAVALELMVGFGVLDLGMVNGN